MANLNVNSWNPLRETVTLRATISTLPAAATAKIDWWTVPTIARPDGAAAGASTGGSANVRFVVDSCTWVNGATISTIVGSLVVDLVNVTQAGDNIATATLAAGDIDVAGDTKAMTLATATSTRNSVTVPDTVLFGGDQIAFSATGTNAGDLVKVGAQIELVGHWEEQTQVAA